MIDAMVISVQESQLDRCLNAVNTQTVPFFRVLHLDSVVPESEAVNRGFDMAENEWVMKVDGDIILYSNAHEIVLSYIKKENDPKICAYYFALIDTFLDVEMGFCGVLRTSVYRSVRRKDKLRDDGNVVHQLRRNGWIIRKLLTEKVFVGTHFDKPNEFEVFKRFYCAGMRSNDNSFNINRMTELFKKTENPLYLVGIKAVKFSKIKNYYPGSRNVNFDRELFAEFNESFDCDSNLQ